MVPVLPDERHVGWTKFAPPLQSGQSRGQSKTRGTLSPPFVKQSMLHRADRRYCCRVHFTKPSRPIGVVQASIEGKPTKRCVRQDPHFPEQQTSGNLANAEIRASGSPKVLP